MGSAHVCNTDQASFETDVIAASMQTPVLVDFWAPWCGPCKTLMPMLERVVDSFDGAVKLAKVNTDEEQMLGQMFGIRSLPTVVLFKDGKPVDGFMGAQPEGAVRQFLAKHMLADEAEAMLDEAAEEPDPIEADVEEKIAALQAKISADGTKEEPKIELADLLAQSGQIEAAETLLASLQALAEGDGAARVRARIGFARIAEAAPSAVDLQDSIAKDPKNLGARHQLAARFMSANLYPQALDQWLVILKTDRTFQSDVGRKSLLDAFRVIDDASLVGEYRRKLSSALF
jgi:putative thioredoxin